jgi:hypothetical protein
VHTLKTDKQQRVRLPDAKPGQVFAYEMNHGVIMLHQIKKVEDEVEILDLNDLDPKTLAPKERGEVSNESIVRAIRADRDSQ